MRPYEARALDLAARIREVQGHPEDAEEARARAEEVRAAIRPARTPAPAASPAEGAGDDRGQGLERPT